MWNALPLWSLLVLPSLPISDTPITIVGRVVDGSHGEPVAQVAVGVPGSHTTTLTDDSGLFRLLVVDISGPIKAQFLRIGYQPTIQEITPGTFNTVTIESVPLLLDGLAVVGSRFSKIAGVGPKALEISGLQSQRMAGSLSDISRTVQAMPGVVGGTEMGNDLMIRGGAGNEVAYSLDGFRIPQINHHATQGSVGGVASSIPASALGDVDVYTGGFSTRHGGAASGVIELHSDLLGGDEAHDDEVMLSSMGGALLVRSEWGARGRWLGSIRHSYTKLVFDWLGLPLRPTNTDALFLGQLDLGQGQDLRFLALGLRDRMDFLAENPITRRREGFNDGMFGTTQTAYTVGVRFNEQIGSGSRSISLTHSGAASRYTSRDLSDDLLFLSDQNEQTTEFGVDGYWKNEPWTTTYSAGLGLFHLDSESFQDPDYSLTGSAFEWNSAILDARPNSNMETSRFYPEINTTAAVGVRVDYSALLNKVSISPRVHVKKEWTQDLETSLSGGLYSQVPPLHILVVQEASREVNRALRHIQALQVASTLSWRLRPRLLLDVAGYRKQYSNYPVVRDFPGASLAHLGFDFGAMPAVPMTPTGTGHSHGLELGLKADLSARNFVQLTHSLSSSMFSGADSVLRPSIGDIRNSGALSLGWGIGEHWDIGGRVAYASGRPDVMLDRERTVATFARTGRGAYDYSTIGERRLAPYFRLDARIERRFHLYDMDWNIALDLQNLTGRPNEIMSRAYADPNRVAKTLYSSKLGGNPFIPGLFVSVKF